MMNRLVSIIVPIFRVDTYLKRALNSILNQTYNQLEIILVDDGSPDRSGEICDYYIQKDNRIKVIHNTNGGLSSARNVGINMAKGEFLAFVDADDYIQPHMIERLVNVAETVECEIVQCNFFRFKSEIPEEQLREKEEILSREDALDRIDNAVYMAAWNKLYRKELFSTIRFPEGKIHEDVGCTYRLFYACNKICIIQDELYGYYINEESITTAKIKCNKLDLLDAYSEQMKFFLEHGLKHCYIRSGNNLAACFGTLLSYESNRYFDFDLFQTELQKRFTDVRPELLRCPLRADLYLAVLFSFGNVRIMRKYHKIKARL